MCLRTCFASFNFKSPQSTFQKIFHQIGSLISQLRVLSTQRAAHVFIFCPKRSITCWLLSRQTICLSATYVGKPIQSREMSHLFPLRTWLIALRTRPRMLVGKVLAPETGGREGQLLQVRRPGKVGTGNFSKNIFCIDISIFKSWCWSRLPKMSVVTSEKNTFK